MAFIGFVASLSVCERPFTIYRWKPGSKARYKKTELCHTCAKLKNCCQTCILDLQFGLPLQVRDQALAEHERIAVPKSDVGRGYMIEQHERAQENVGIVGQTSVVDINTLQKGSMLDRLARRTPYYKRNMAHRWYAVQTIKTARWRAPHALLALDV